MQQRTSRGNEPQHQDYKEVFGSDDGLHSCCLILWNHSRGQKYVSLWLESDEYKMKYRIFYLFLVLVTLNLLLGSCRKDNVTNRVPYVYVNFLLYPNSLDYIPTGGWVYSTGGYRGIVIYRMTEDQFFAYDRCCPYDPENIHARVIIESTGITVVDTVCGSRFLLTDGYPFKGPSRSPLLQYRTSFDGERLSIFN
jgi:nitrite reductase/ring-hydroxylating ferredoxin subunit